MDGNTAARKKRVWQSDGLEEEHSWEKLGNEVVNLETDQIQEVSEYRTKFSFYLISNGQALKVSEQGSNIIKAVIMRNFLRVPSPTSFLMKKH